jgi:uncharacterized protein
VPAVSDTYPLRYLIAVGRQSLLFQLFGEILIPPGVRDELCDPAAPRPVRDWIEKPRQWFRVQPLSSQPDRELEAALDRGEREAIQLALERKPEALIIDEHSGTNGRAGPSPGLAACP